MSFADGAFRPRWRGRLHLVGFVLALTATPALLTVADSLAASVGLAVYATSLLLLFGTSAAYHLLARTEQTQRIMRRLDHSMIFVLIAGTYTPVCLLALPRSWGLPILAAIWLAAVSGVALKLLAGDWLLRASNVLYILLGWIALGALPVILRHLTTGEFTLLVIGGVLYTVGAILFALRRPQLLPSTFGYHEVWHGFTVLAAFAHFGMVWSVAL
ncbi:MAG: hemolysin III family protein [Actinomycetota bacterium]